MTTSPAFRLSLGLSALLACAIILADLFFGLVPALTDDDRAHQAALAEIAAAYAIEASTFDRHTVEQRLDTVRRRSPGILAIAVRDRTGALLASSGAAPDKASNRVVAQLASSQGRWGVAEFNFAPPPHTGATAWLLVGLVATVGVFSYLYLRRALLYLDPMSVVPERLRAAFDCMTEGIALLDQRNRVVLGNRALRDMASVEANALHGRRLETVAQLAFDTEAALPPWHTVTSTGEAVRGVRVRVGHGDQPTVGNMNCAPIVDASGKQRGCLVTVTDVTAIEQSNDQLRCAMAEIEMSRAHIAQQNEELTRLATVDGLTGLLNRRAFFQNAQEKVTRQTHSHGTVAVLMLDVDHFKTFNDRFGHTTGDVVLQRVASCVAEAVRPDDLAARYGGEEFCVLVENLDEAGVLGVAERLRKSVQSHAGAGVHDGADLTVTISIGVAISPPAAGALQALVQLADAALYTSKRGGRNRVTLAGASGACAAA